MRVIKPARSPRKFGMPAAPLLITKRSRGSVSSRSAGRQVWVLAKTSTAEMAKAERAYDLNKIAELKHGRIPQLEKELAQAEKGGTPRGVNRTRWLDIGVARNAWGRQLDSF